MKVKLNGNVEHVDDALSVAALVDQFADGQRRGIAIAVNGSVVSKSKWDDHLLQEGDAVEIVRATQGG